MGIQTTTSHVLASRVLLAWHRLHVFASNSDWFIVYICYDWSEQLLWFWFYNTELETALMHRYATVLCLFLCLVGIAWYSWWRWRCWCSRNCSKQNNTFIIGLLVTFQLCPLISMGIAPVYKAWHFKGRGSRFCANHVSKYFFALARYVRSLFNLIRCLWQQPLHLHHLWQSLPVPHRSAQPQQTML